MAAGVRLALWTLAAAAWAVARGDAGVRLVVSASEDASCPLRVALLDERRPEGEKVELCTRALPVSLEGFSPWEESTEPVSGLFSQRAPPSTSAIRDSTNAGIAEDDPVRVPDNYTRLPGGGFYKLHEERFTWLEAKAMCETEGAHLVVIDDKDEAAYLKEYLESIRGKWRKQPFTLHAGFYMDFTTLSGRSLSSLGYERWAWGHPAAGVCGRLDQDAWLLFGACSDRQRFICERSPVVRAPAAGGATAAPPPLPPSPPATPPSPPPATLAQVMNAIMRGYSQVIPGSSVFYKRQELTLQNFRGNPWEDASRACLADGARLAVVESAAEAEALVDFFQVLPDYEPRGDTLLGLRTADPVDVLGNPLSFSSYLRWAEKTFPQSCVCVDIKVQFRTCSCENPSLSFLCKMSSQ